MYTWIIFQALISFLLIFYFYIRKKYSYWSSRGVPGPRAVFPFGYTLDKARHDPFDLETKWLGQYGKVYGVYTGFLPTLIISDPELVKQVFIKDFQYFANRRNLNSFHPVWNSNIFIVDKEEWKRYRTITTPAFSTSKLRNMNPLIKSCIGKLVAKLDSVPNGTFIPREIFTNFSIDITSATFFATETNANSVGSERNPIVQKCLDLIDIPAYRSMAIEILPRPLLNLLGISCIFNNDAMAYIVKLLRTIVAQQKALPTASQNDFIRLLIEAKEGDNESNGNKDSNGSNGKSLTETEIIAQCFVYFQASYEQIASALTYCAYELAMNEDIQERLYHDIQNAVGELDETRGWAKRCETIMNEVPYLEAVMKESLRKYPPELRLERRVSAEGAKIGEIPMEKDVLIIVPTIALHHNPEYFPDPERFDPERFSPENKHHLVPYAYLPFGAGPRNCIGNRFAYQVAKLCWASLLLKYQFRPTVDTPKKLKFVSGNMSLLMPTFPLAISAR